MPTMTANQNTEKPDEQLPAFEPSLKQLEQIIEAIESGEVTLEQSLEKYSHGMKLIKHCRGILDRAETKIKELTVEEDGEVSEKS